MFYFLISIIAAVATIIPIQKSYELSDDTSNDVAQVCLPQECLRIMGPRDLNNLIENAPNGLKFNIGPEYFAGSTEFGTKEGYKIEITDNQICISAASKAGAFYATQTIIQLQTNSGLRLGTIIDEPSHSYRGLLFDVSRHFRSVDFIKKQLDAMAFLKLNRLHFHLDDSVGWRIELDSHPELVRTSAFRKELLYHKPSTFIDVPVDYIPGTVWNEEGCYGGYYSKEQIKEIIAYADSLNITIIPEIEIPGHSGELRISHPEIFCSTSNDKCESVCPGTEATFKLFEEILEEVIDLFPSQYIHIGGDEAKKDAWKTCPLCQQRIKEEKLKDELELQSYTIRRISDFVKSKGRKIIGWDEIMQGGLCEDATVMCWRDVKYGIEAAKLGNEVIMTPYEHFYLDKYQNSHHLEPHAIVGYLPLDKIRSFEVPDLAGIAGVQANLWTEYIIEDSHFEYMLYPRAFAAAELGWSSWKIKSDNYAESFRSRAQTLSAFFTQNGYTVFDIDREVGIDPILLGSTVKHKAYKATYTYTGAHPTRIEENPLTRLTDGRERTFMQFDGPTSVVINLKRKTDLCMVCGVFKRVTQYGEIALPSEVKVYVSPDGKNWILSGVRNAMMDDENCSWQISYIPVFCSHKKVRYIKMEVTPSRYCSSIGLSEILVY